MAKSKNAKKNIANKNNKQDIPVLKTPTESRAGRIVIWIILIAMILASIGGLIAAIILTL